jgi:hypothetical protein
MLLISAVAHAQYTGGNGAGEHVASNTGSFFTSSFAGGFGKGDASASLSGTNLFNAMFLGGNGKGDALNTYTSANLFNAMFTGGNGRGDITANYLATGFFSSPFTGGNGKGDAVAVYSGSNFYSSIFLGGNGKGDASAGSVGQMFGCSSSISADGPTTFCTGSTVTLTSSTGASYLWSNGATTSGILVTSSGNYSVTVTNLNNCRAISPATTVTVNICFLSLNMKCYIEGYYQGNGTQAAVLDPVALPSICDSITVELHQSFSPYDLAYTANGTIDINGNGSFVFPGGILGNSFYVVIRHRMALETWSKNPVLFNASSVNMDFTTP